MHAALTVNLSFDDAEVVSGGLKSQKILELLKAVMPQFHEKSFVIVEGRCAAISRKKVLKNDAERIGSVL